MENVIHEAIEAFKNGGIVIFPTDTAFGIGCRMDDEKAVQRLFKIRKRPEAQATSVLVDSIDVVQEYIEPISVEVRKQLMERYWPGALTIILRCIRVKVLSLVRGGGDTLGLRMPNHKLILEIIKAVGVPILGPSANFHGKPTPFEFSDIDKNLLKMVDYVVDGECTIKKPSTVIDCSKKPWRILREGAVEI